MDVVIATFLTSAVGVILLGLAAREASGVINWATFKVLRVATLRLPQSIRAERGEEWAAELATLERARVSKLVLALRLLRAASRMLDEPKPITVELDSAELKLEGQELQAGNAGGHLELSAGMSVSRHVVDSVRISESVSVSVTPVRTVTTAGMAAVYADAEYVTHEQAGD